MGSYTHIMPGASCFILLLVAATSALAAGPDRLGGSLAGQSSDAWHAVAPISSHWMHVPDTALPADATSAAAAAVAVGTIEIGTLSLEEGHPRMLTQAAAPKPPPAAAATAAPKPKAAAAAPKPPAAAAAAAQKCMAYSKDMNQHTKDGYKLRWKAFSDKCSAACRKQTVIKVPDGIYKVYCDVQSCICTLVSETTKKKYGGVRLEYAATRASDGAFVAAFVVKGELYPTAAACEKCAGPYSFCRNC